MKEGEEEGELLGSRLLFRKLKHPKKNSKGGSVYVRKLRSSMYFCFESLTLDRLYPVKGIKRRERVYEGKCPINQVYVFQANGDKTKASVKRESCARPKRSEREIRGLGKRQWSLMPRSFLPIIIWIFSKWRPNTCRKCKNLLVKFSLSEIKNLLQEKGLS